MGPLLVVEGQISPNPLSGLSPILVCLQVHLLVLDAAPQPFHETLELPQNGFYEGINIDRLLNREPALYLEYAGETFWQVLHGDEVVISMLSDLEDVDYVGVGDVDAETGLKLEALDVVASWVRWGWRTLRATTCPVSLSHAR